MKQPPAINAHIALLIVSAIYGFFYVAIKLLLVDLSPTLILWLRLTLSACIVLPIEWLVIKSKFSKIDFIKAIVIGLIGVYGVHFALLEGTAKTSSFFAALIMASVPLVTLLFSILVQKEVPKLQRTLGMGIGFLGVVSVLLQKNGFSGNAHYPDMLEGNLWVFAAAIAFAIFLLFSEDLLKRYSSFSLMAYSYIFSAIALSATLIINPSLLASVNFESLKHASMNHWLLIGFLVVGASILTYTLNHYALKRTSPNVVSIYMFLAPLQSALWGYFILHEPFTWLMSISGVLTFVGIWLANRSHPVEHMMKEAAAETLTDIEETVG